MTIDDMLAEIQLKEHNKSLSIEELKLLKNEPIFIVCDNKSWWDILENVVFSDINNSEQHCYIHTKIFGPCHYKTFRFYRKRI